MVGSIRFEGVKKTFHTVTGETVNALSGVDLEIEKGKFVCLIGPSGCGKSTMLRILAGLDKPTEGSVYIDDEKVKKPDCDRGLVFQDPNLFPWLNIYDNVAFGLKVRKLYKERSADISEYMELVGLKGFEKSYPHQLSGGMCQRASLARALIGHPKALLLDEPLGALDAFTRMNMQDEILRLWKEHNTTMVMVTHDVDEAVYLSDYVVVMSPRPAKVEKIIKVNLSHPRARGQDVFLNYRTQILEILDYAGKVQEAEFAI